MASYGECTLGKAMDAVKNDPVQRAMLLMSCQQRPYSRIYDMKYAIDYADSEKLNACVVVEKKKYNEYTIKGIYKLGTSPILTVEKNNKVIYEKKNVAPGMVMKAFQDACK